MFRRSESMLTQNLYACSVCFGAKDLSVRLAVAAGIFVLLGILLCVLGGIVAFFIRIQRRAKNLV